LGLEPGDLYHCAWCNTTSLLDPKRFQLAAFATAILFILFSLAAYLVLRSLGGVVAAMVLWIFLSPLAYTEWVNLRLAEQSSPPPSEALRAPAQEAARQEEEVP
jgi:hypothetical protein